MPNSKIVIGKISDNRFEVGQSVYIPGSTDVRVYRSKEDNEVYIVIDGECGFSIDEAKELIDLIHEALALADKF